MVPEKKQSVLLFLRSFLFWFAIFWLLSQAYFSFFGESAAAPIAGSSQGVVIKPTQDSFVMGQLVVFSLENKSDVSIVFSEICPGSDVALARQVNAKLVDVTDAGVLCNDLNLESLIAPGESLDLAFSGVNTEVFSEEGAYVLRMNLAGTEYVSTPVGITSPGVFRQLFRAVITKPLFNVMIWFTEVLPWKSFGLAIILLTLLVRLILFFPSLKSIKSQKAMQAIQPKLEAIKKEHKDNQQMIAMKTMELYKTHGVNPFSSCLPVLLQMPFLLGVYFIVREGVSPHVSYLLFEAQSGVDLAMIDTQFWGLDLSIAQLSILPFLVAVAQWGALKLSLGAGVKTEKGIAKTQAQQVNAVMLWVMPLMIGFFAATLPSGVGIYWLTSTSFGVLQSLLVKSHFGGNQVRKKV